MYTINCKGKLCSLNEPVIMGILNITPDSFFERHWNQPIDAVLEKAEQMLQDGAMLLDIGGQSTRPGSTWLEAEEEWQRVEPVITAIHKRFPDALLSIDTFHSAVAFQAVQAGASVVNDVSGGNLDELMITTVGKLKVPYICMHMKGTPATMTGLAEYEAVALEVCRYFVDKIAECHRAGIVDLILDPGFGFAKNATQNFQLLKGLPQLKALGKPILAGLSRKSTIYKTLGITAEESLNGTTAMHSLALMNGASILRVHDVREAMQVVKLWKAYQQA